jgi:chaperonin GroES
MEGEVMAVGPGRRTDDGKLVPMNVSPGEQVIFAKYAGTEFELDEGEFLILQEKDILGVVVEEA